MRHSLNEVGEGRGGVSYPLHNAGNNPRGGSSTQILTLNARDAGSIRLGSCEVAAIDRGLQLSSIRYRRSYKQSLLVAAVAVQVGLTCGFSWGWQRLQILASFILLKFFDLF